MVITSCSTTGQCALTIAYNDQIPLCENSRNQLGPCRDPEALCVADPDFAFNFAADDNPVRGLVSPALNTGSVC